MDRISNAFAFMFWNAFLKIPRSKKATLDVGLPFWECLLFDNGVCFNFLLLLIITLTARRPAWFWPSWGYNLPTSSPQMLWERLAKRLFAPVRPAVGFVTLQQSDTSPEGSYYVIYAAPCIERLPKRRRR